MPKILTKENAELMVGVAENIQTYRDLLPLDIGDTKNIMSLISLVGWLVGDGYAKEYPNMDVEKRRDQAVDATVEALVPVMAFACGVGARGKDITAFADYARTRQAGVNDEG